MKRVLGSGDPVRAAVRRFLTKVGARFPGARPKRHDGSGLFFEERANWEGRRIWRRGYAQHGVLEKVYAGHCFGAGEATELPKAAVRLQKRPGRWRSAAERVSRLDIWYDGRFTNGRIMWVLDREE